MGSHGDLSRRAVERFSSPWVRSDGCLQTHGKFKARICRGYHKRHAHPALRKMLAKLIQRFGQFSLLNYDVDLALAKRRHNLLGSLGKEGLVPQLSFDGFEFLG